MSSTMNINDRVRIKLTPTGRSLIGVQMVFVKEDAEGWSEWQLWHLMQMVGSLVYNGCTLPFETTIQLDWK